jgi:hypothetical protein
LGRVADHEEGTHFFQDGSFHGAPSVAATAARSPVSSMMRALLSFNAGALLTDLGIMAVAGLGTFWLLIQLKG